MARPPSVGDQDSLASNDSRLFKATRRDVYQSLICITGCLVALGAFIAVVTLTFMYNLSIATAAFSLLGIGIICGVAVSICLKITAYYTQTPSPTNNLVPNPPDPTQAKSVGSLLEKGDGPPQIGTLALLPPRETTMPGGDKATNASLNADQGPPLEAVHEPPPVRMVAPTESAIPFYHPSPFSPLRPAAKSNVLGPRGATLTSSARKSWVQSVKSYGHSLPMRFSSRAKTTSRGGLPSQFSSSTEAV